MPIEHIGLGVPDVEAAKRYYDELLPLVGFQPCFGNGYCPDDWEGAQLFLYRTDEDGAYSRHRAGLQHIAFLVPTRADVHRVHDWVRSRGDKVIHQPDRFPQYGEHCFATYFLDPHGFMLEAVCHRPPEEPGGTEG